MAVTGGKWGLWVYTVTAGAKRRARCDRTGRGQPGGDGMHGCGAADGGRSAVRARREIARGGGAVAGAQAMEDAIDLKLEGTRTGRLVGTGGPRRPSATRPNGRPAVGGSAWERWTAAAGWRRMWLCAGAVVTAVTVLWALGESAHAARSRAADAGIDYTVYRAGQHLRLDLPDLPDDEDDKCTAAFPVRIGRTIYGLTAGHCAVRGVGTRVFRQMPSNETGTELGTVRRNLHGPGGLDALVFTRSFAPGRWAQEIERGPNPPLKVNGALATDEQAPGLRVCSAGRTTGADNCGTITEALHTMHLDGYGGASDSQVICTNIHGDAGDSGGPVYTAPHDGRTYAVGLVTGGQYGETMCYTPIHEILHALGALDRLPQPGEIH
jgi:hypothetical protein